MEEVPRPWKATLEEESSKGSSKPLPQELAGRSHRASPQASEDRRQSAGARASEEMGCGWFSECGEKFETGTNCLEINPYAYGQLIFFSSGCHDSSMRKKSFSNIWEWKTGYPPYPKVNLKCANDPNARPKTLKLLEENMGINLYYF